MATGTLKTKYTTLTEGTTPSTPASGDHTVYIKSDGLMYKVNSSGTESTINSPVYVSANASSNANSYADDATLQINTEVVDTHNAFNTSTYTFTAPRAGYYEVSGNFMLKWASGVAAGQSRGFRIKKNGTSQLNATHDITSSPAGDRYKILSASIVLSLAASDTVTFGYQTGSGGSDAQDACSNRRWDITIKELL